MCKLEADKNLSIHFKAASGDDRQLLFQFFQMANLLILLILNMRLIYPNNAPLKKIQRCVCPLAEKDIVGKLVSLRGHPSDNSLMSAALWSLSGGT